ncbi:hypothetical protein KCU81_g203, partial [Aureobasidium melanogenum]
MRIVMVPEQPTKSFPEAPVTRRATSVDSRTQTMSGDMSNLLDGELLVTPFSSTGRATAEAANSMAVARIELKSILISIGVDGWWDGGDSVGRSGWYLTSYLLLEDQEYQGTKVTSKLARACAVTAAVKVGSRNLAQKCRAYLPSYLSGSCFLTSDVASCVCRLLTLSANDTSHVEVLKAQGQGTHEHEAYLLEAFIRQSSFVIVTDTSPLLSLTLIFVCYDKMDISPQITDCEEQPHSVRNVFALQGRTRTTSTQIMEQLSSPLQSAIIFFKTARLAYTDSKEVDFDGSKVWQGLPFFGQQARECWNFPYHKEVDAKTRDAWINVNAFVARLTAVAINEHGGERQGYSALDYSLYGIWSLRSALEEDWENLPGENTTDASVGAAAVWLAYAGPTLKGLSDSNKTYSGKVAKPGSKFKDEEWRGYTKDRWLSWKKELTQAKSLVQDNNISGLTSYRSVT